MADELNVNDGSRIISKGTKRISTVSKALTPAFIDGVLAELKQMDTKSGQVLSDNQRNRNLINSVRGNVRNVLNSVGYFDAVNNFLFNFDLLSDFQKGIHEQLSGIVVKGSQITPFRKWAIDKVLFDLQGQGLDAALINPIKQEMKKAVDLGGNFQDMSRSVESFLRQGKNGHLDRIVQLGSQDALGQFNGLVNDAVRREFNLDGFVYVGSVVEGTRPQCLRWLAMREIPWAGFGKEIEWANRNGTGWIKGTTKDLFLQNRGGYRCRHDAIPKRLSKNV